MKVRVEKGYGPRHAFNAQEGTEAVPSELPTPPDAPDTLGDRIRRSLFEQVRQGVLPDEALAQIKRDPKSLQAMQAYAEAALVAGTMLSRGEGFKPGRGRVTGSYKGSELKNTGVRPLTKAERIQAMEQDWADNVGTKPPQEAYDLIEREFAEPTEE